MTRPSGKSGEVDLKDSSGKVLQRVSCELLEVDGIELAFHKTPNQSAWQITEPQTGRVLTRGHVSKDSALAAAESVIRKHGIDTIRTLIGKAGHA